MKLLLKTLAQHCLPLAPNCLSSCSITFVAGVQRIENLNVWKLAECDYIVRGNW